MIIHNKQLTMIIAVITSRSFNYNHPIKIDNYLCEYYCLFLSNYDFNVLSVDSNPKHKLFKFDHNFKFDKISPKFFGDIIINSYVP